MEDMLVEQVDDLVLVHCSLQLNFYGTNLNHILTFDTVP